MPENPSLLLATPRLKLRPVVEMDAAATAELVTPDVAEQLLTWPSPMSREEALARIKASRKALGKGEAVDFAILSATDERLMGWIGLGTIKSQGTRLGYWLGADFRGAGLMTEAARAVIGPTTAFLGVQSVFAFSRKTNRPSIAVLEALGFQPNGEESQFFKFKGISESCLRYELAVRD